MEDILHAAGADEVITINRYAHLVGGARMAADEQHGVVDADCRSFAVPNLYITDGSVLPTQGSANPALTIMAVAARAADQPVHRTDARRRPDLEEERHGTTPSPTTCSSRLREWGVDTVFGYPGDGINGILAAWGRADDQPRFIQARHEEMAAFEAVGYAKFTGRRRGLHGHLRARARSTCSTACTTPSSTTCRWWRSSGRPTARAMGGSYQQEVDLLSLFKDVASDYVQMVTVPEQLPNVLDRAIRIALAERAPTARHHPHRRPGAGVRRRPTHAFKMVPSSLGIELAARRPRRRRPSRRAAEILNAGEQGRDAGRLRARAAPRPRSSEVADLLGAGVAKALLGKDVLSDELPWVTGSIGLLGTRPSYEMMTGLRHPAHRRLELPLHPVPARVRPGARRCRSTSTPTLIGMRYPYEVNLVGDAAATLRALIPLLQRKERPLLAGRASRPNVRPLVGDHGRRGRWSRPTRSTRCGCSASCRRGCPTTRSSPPTPARRPTGTPGSCGSAATCAARCRATWPPWAPACRTASAPSSPTPTGR